MWDSARPVEVPQSVAAGDATGQYEGNRASVATSAQQGSPLRVRLAPVVATPNGDGVNEWAGVEYGILDITGEAAVDVAVSAPSASSSSPPAWRTSAT